MDKGQKYKNKNQLSFHRVENEEQKEYFAGFDTERLTLVLLFFSI